MDELRKRLRLRANRLKSRIVGFFRAHLLGESKRYPAVKSKQTTMVFDSITGVYIRRVPIYEAGDSCKLHGDKHLWVLNTVHKKVCIRCGMVTKITSFYGFAAEAGLLKLWAGN
jgi:hypothetical protein